MHTIELTDAELALLLEILIIAESTGELSEEQDVLRQKLFVEHGQN
jgi:hypothetical protein